MGTNGKQTRHNTMPEPTLASPQHWARTRGVRAAENRTKLDAERPAHEPLTQKPSGFQTRREPPKCWALRASGRRTPPSSPRHRPALLPHVCGLPYARPAAKTQN